jgi:MerR family transcriptional regulator/heat shock protein HspR
MISVAAELAGVHPQTLRIYERKQLVRPQRSAGNTRLYSDADIERLRLIQQLTQDEGVNLAGVERIIELQERLEALVSELAQMQARMAMAERRAREADARAGYKAEIVLVKRGGIEPVRRAR